MLHLLFQAAEKAIPPITVVVQAPPTSGIPEVVKILLSAVTGAVLGVGGSLSTEYVKTTIAERRLNTEMSEQLTEELTSNLDKVAAGTRILTIGPAHSEEIQRQRMGTMLLILQDVTDDRYQDYFMNRKALIYQFDKSQSLTEFYKNTSKALAAVKDVDYELAKVFFKLATLQGHKYLKTHKITYEPKETVYEYYISPESKWAELALRMPKPPPHMDDDLLS